VVPPRDQPEAGDEITINIRTGEDAAIKP